MQNDFIEKNKYEFLRLKNFLFKMDEVTWRVKTGNSWNAGGVFWHIAFWDKMTTERLKSWKTSGKLAAIPDSENIDAINATFREISELMDLKCSKIFILQCGEEIDDMVARFNPEDLQLLKDSGKERWFQRYKHRSEHLNKLEAALFEKA